MNSRDKILAAIRANKPAPQPHPGAFEPVRSIGPREQYVERTALSGGAAEFLSTEESPAHAIGRLFPDARYTLSFVPEVPSSVVIPSENSGYTTVDLAVIPGSFAVAENGAVWGRHDGFRFTPRLLARA